MHEHHLKKFKYITSDTSNCAIELLEEPFTGVKLYLGTQVDITALDTGELAANFDYDIFDNPESLQLDQYLPELEDLIRGIFLGVMEKAMNADQEKGHAS